LPKAPIAPMALGPATAGPWLRRPLAAGAAPRADQMARPVWDPQTGVRSPKLGQAGSRLAEDGHD
jgi:hypothetical protein